MLYTLKKEYNIILKLFYYVKIDFQRKKTSNLSLFYIILLIFFEYISFYTDRYFILFYNKDKYTGGGTFSCYIH